MNSVEQIEMLLASILRRKAQIKINNKKHNKEEWKETNKYLRSENKKALKKIEELKNK